MKIRKDLLLSSYLYLLKAERKDQQILLDKKGSILLQSFSYRTGSSTG